MVALHHVFTKPKRVFTKTNKTHIMSTKNLNSQKYNILLKEIVFYVP